MSPAAPAPAPAPAWAAPWGEKPRKALRVNGSGRMPKRYRNQHSRRRRWGRIKPGSWPGSSAGRRSFPRSKWAKWAKVWQGAPLVPSSCPPAFLPCSGHAPKRAAGAAPPSMSSRAKGKSWYFRFGTENACQGITLDRMEYSCVCNYLQFGRQYVDMSTCDFLPFIYLYIVHIYERFTTYSNSSPSSFPSSLHPSACMHLSAQSRSMVATGSPFHSA